VVFRFISESFNYLFRARRDRLAAGRRRRSDTVGEEGAIGRQARRSPRYRRYRLSIGC